MKYINEVPEVMKVALSMMLYTTCGQDEEILAESEITAIGPNTFHITFQPEDPFNGLDLKLSVETVLDEGGTFERFHYNVFESVYADTGEFDIATR